MPEGAPIASTRKRLPDGMTPRLLAGDAGAAYCGGISKATFLDLVAPHVRSLKIGARRLFDVHSIDRWVDARSAGEQLASTAGSWVDRAGDDDPNGRH
jgi:hypothetical protein